MQTFFAYVNGIFLHYWKLPSIGPSSTAIGVIRAFFSGGFAVDSFDVSLPFDTFPLFRFTSALMPFFFASDSSFSSSFDTAAVSTLSSLATGVIFLVLVVSLFFVSVELCADADIDADAAVILDEVAFLDTSVPKILGKE